MKETKKAGAIVLSIINYVFFALYVTVFVLIGILCKMDDGAGYGFLVDGIASFPLAHLKLIPDLFALGSEAGLYWSFILFGAIMLVTAGFIYAIHKARKYRRAITIPNVFAVILTLIPIVLTASSFHVYLEIIQQKGLYVGCSALLKYGIIALLATGGIFLILTVVSLFVNANNAKKYPNIEEVPEEAKLEEPEEEQKEDDSEEDDEPVNFEVIEEGKKQTNDGEMNIDGMKKEELMDLIKEAIREVLKEECGEAKITQEGDASVITGAFGMPVVVQYFGKKGKKDAEPETKAVASEPVAPVVEEAAPVVAPVVEEPVEEVKKAPREKHPFNVKITKMEKDMQEEYNSIKNELLAYGLKSRVSSSADIFRLHRKTYVKLVIAGKGLKLFFALDPRDYKDSKMPILDVSDKGSYTEIPLGFKVKSDLSKKRVRKLIEDCVNKDHLEKGEVQDVNWIKEYKAEIRAKKQAAKEAEENY